VRCSVWVWGDHAAELQRDLYDRIISEHSNVVTALSVVLIIGFEIKFVT
jgi:hypothetical protein